MRITVSVGLILAAAATMATAGPNALYWQRSTVELPLAAFYCLWGVSALFGWLLVAHIGTIRRWRILSVGVTVVILMAALTGPVGTLGTIWLIDAVADSGRRRPSDWTDRVDRTWFGWVYGLGLMVLAGVLTNAFSRIDLAVVWALLAATVFCAFHRCGEPSAPGRCERPTDGGS